VNILFFLKWVTLDKRHKLSGFRGTLINFGIFLWVDFCGNHIGRRISLHRDPEARIGHEKYQLIEKIFPPVGIEPGTPPLETDALAPIQPRSPIRNHKAVTGIAFGVVNDESLPMRKIVILHWVINEIVLFPQAQQHKHIDASKSRELDSSYSVLPLHQAL
jgi:hypothetical protein